jgi:hypothetical protein
MMDQAGAGQPFGCQKSCELKEALSRQQNHAPNLVLNAVSVLRFA